MNDRLLKKLILKEIRSVLNEGEVEADVDFPMGRDEEASIMSALKLTKIKLEKIHRTADEKDIGSRQFRHKLSLIVSELDKLSRAGMGGESFEDDYEEEY